MKITKEELAARLNGREYGSEITKDEEKLAKENNLVVVYGASDDLCEFAGATYDEIGCYGGKSINIYKKGIFPDWEEVKDDEELAAEYLKNKKKVVRTIKAIWCGKEGFNWTYETDIPHVTFEIFDDGEKYARNIIFSLDDL